MRSWESGRVGLRVSVWGRAGGDRHCLTNCEFVARSAQDQQVKYSSAPNFLSQTQSRNDGALERPPPVRSSQRHPRMRGRGSCRRGRRPVRGLPRRRGRSRRRSRRATQALQATGTAQPMKEDRPLSTWKFKDKALSMWQTTAILRRIVQYCVLLQDTAGRRHPRMRVPRSPRTIFGSR